MEEAWVSLRDRVKNGSKWDQVALKPERFLAYMDEIERQEELLRWVPVRERLPNRNEYPVICRRVWRGEDTYTLATGAFLPSRTTLPPNTTDWRSVHGPR